MNEIEELGKIEREISASFKKLNKDFNFVSFARFETLIIKLLEECMDDKAGNWDSWVSWWVYETDFGHNKTLSKSPTKNGKKYPLKNSGDLYDLITTK